MTVIGTAFVSIKGKDDLTPMFKKFGDEAEKEVGDKPTKAASRFRTAMSTMGTSITSALGPAYAPIGEVVDKLNGVGSAIEEMHKKTGKAFLGIGAGATAAGTFLTMAGDKGRVATGQLKLAVENAGGSWDEYKKQTEEAIHSNERFGHTETQTEQALQTLVTRTGNVSGSYKNMNLVVDLAAAKHMSLQNAAGVVARVMDGNTRVLRMYGITQADINKITNQGVNAQKSKQLSLLQTQGAEQKAALETLKERDATISNQLAMTKDKSERTALRAELNSDKLKRQELTKSIADNKQKTTELTKEIKANASGTSAGAAAATLLAQKLHGQASVEANTFTGRLKEMRAKTEDFIESWGQKVGPALQASGPALMGIGTIIESGVIGKIGNGIKVFNEWNKMQKISQAVTKVSTGINYAFGLSEDAALGPIILIVAAVAAVAAAFVIAYIKIKPFHELIDTIGRAIRTGFIDALHGVEDALKWLVSAFETAWNFIWGIVKKYGVYILVAIAPIIGIPVLIMMHWGKIVDFFKKIWDDVTKVLGYFVHDIVNFFQNLYHEVDQIASNLVNDVTTFFKSLPGRIVNALASLASSVGGAISRGFSNVSNIVQRAFGAAGSWLLNAGKNAIDGFIAGAQRYFGSIYSGLVSAKNTVINAFAGAGSWLLGVGGDIIRGLVAGIGNLGGVLTSAVESMAGSVPSVIKKVLKSLSPSRVMMEIGGNVSQGMAIGITQQSHLVKKASDNMSKLAVPTVQTVTPHVGAVAHTAGGAGGYTKIFNLFPNATIDFGKQNPVTIVKQLEAALMASRL